MRDLTNKNFGLLIAFLLPGFVTMLGVGCVSQTVASWMRADPSHLPTVGGFLYLTLASLVAGLTVSTIRWAVIDTIHHRTGIPPPHWDFSRLKRNVDLYVLLNENHYRFYQYYANMSVALILVLAARRRPGCAPATGMDALDVGCVLLAILFFCGSRDTFRKFHTRVGQFLSVDDGSQGSSDDPSTMTSPAKERQRASDNHDRPSTPP